MQGVRQFTKLFFVIVAIVVLGACQGGMPPIVIPDAPQGERLGYNFVAATRLDTNPNYRLAMSGYGSFDPQNPGDADGGGSFAQFDASAEGVPKPVVGLGTGVWHVKRGLKYTAHGGVAGGITPGVLDVVVELIPDEGEPVEAVMRIICNVGFTGMVNMEDGEPLPEGFMVTLEDVGTFEPIISDQPGVPPLGLTHIGPVIPDAPQAGRSEYNFVAATRLDTNPNYRLAMSGYGSFDPQNPGDADGGGSFAQFDASAEGVPKPVVGLGTGVWHVKRGLKYTAHGGVAGGITPGVLDVVVELIPDEGEPVEAVMRIICNVGFTGMVNMEDGKPLPEGFIMILEDVGTFEPIISDQPGVPPFGLTHIGPVIS